MFRLFLQYQSNPADYCPLIYGYKQELLWPDAASIVMVQIQLISKTYEGK